MAQYQATRGVPRIVDLFWGAVVDLPFQLDVDPATLRTALLVQRAEDGSVETMPGIAQARLRMLMSAMDTDTQARFLLLYDRTLEAGGLIEVIRDSLRYFWLTGDSARDVAAGQYPVGGSRYTLVSPNQGGPLTGKNQYASGRIAIDRPQQGSAPTRCNLIPNGDFLDGTFGATPTGWVNDTPATLKMSKSAYFNPNGQTGAMAEFIALAVGTKKAHIDFSLDGDNATNLPSEALFLTLKLRSDITPNSASPVTVTPRFLRTTGTTLVAGSAITPRPNWEDRVATFDFTAVVNADTTIRFEVEFSDDLRYAPVYITELQVERGLYCTAFLPYSSVRTSLTGARATADNLRYLNGLVYRNQLQNWQSTPTPFPRWGMVVAAWVRTHWQSSTIPEATVIFYQDGDDAVSGTIPGLKIHATTSTIVATALMDDGTTITASKTSFTFGIKVEHHILATFQDWDGVNANSGSLDLWVDGILAQHTTHSKTAGRQGKYFWWGTSAAGANVAGIDIRDAAIDPVYVDNTTVLVSEYMYGAAYGTGGIRPSRNSYRCVLDPAAIRPDRVQDNTVVLDVPLIEVVA